MYYIYIIYSESSNLYYIGHTDDFQRRLLEHNESDHNTFTSKHRPWKLRGVFECGEQRSKAMALEKFIKNQKNRKLLEQLCNKEFIPNGKLAQLVRVPHVRD